MENTNTDRLNWLLAGLVTLISLIVYYMTMAVSVSLWDCGEFIACSRIFGIAHPPGTPLFIMFGRIFSLIPFGPDIAYRITMVSVISSAASIGLSYLAISKIVSWWLNKRESIWDRLPMYIGGISGALIMAFSRTWWINAVEAEVYGLTLLTSIAAVYLALIWYEKREEPSSDKYIFAMIFITMLGVAAHLAAFMVMPAIFLFIFISSPRLLKEPRVWISFACAMLMVVEFNMFLICTLIWLGICLIFTLVNKSYFWKWALVFTLLSSIGFSIQGSTYIRSQHRPRINMTDPNTIEKMNDYLARKQYGQGNMLTRMLHRRGHLSNQFGNYPRMGMMGFWKDQYSSSKVIFLFLLFVGLWGIYYAMRMRWKMGTLIFLLLLAGTIGITLYMNFADGSQMLDDPNAKLEVRDRDYFWTHGFAMFGWAIGLGIAAFMHSLTNYFRSKEGLGKLIIPVSLIFSLSVFLPILGISQNYNYNNRSGEWLPFQFATDMLNICDSNAVLFTAGDNDTYPLWALQEAYGYRQDVKIINLSLANVDWYVLHAKNVFGAPMGVENDQIEVKKFQTINGEERRPERQYYDKFDNNLTYFGTRPIRDPRTGAVRGVVEMAQLTVEQVIEASLETRGDTLILHTPVYFTSLTEPVRNIRYRNHIRYLERVVNLYKLKDTIILGETQPPSGRYPFTYDIDKSYDIMMNTFIFDGLKDAEFARGEFTTMMTYRYYAAEYSTIIDSLLARNDTTSASKLIEKASSIVPEHFDVPYWRSVIDSLNGGTTEKLFEYQKEYVDYMRELLDIHPENSYYIEFISNVLFDMGNAAEGNEKYIVEALEYLQFGIENNPQSDGMFEGLLKGNVIIQDTSKLILLMKQYRNQNPSTYYRPFFFVAADYIDSDNQSRFETLIRAYFTANGKDTFVFKELLKYTLASSRFELTALLQSVYFEIVPNDQEAMDYIRSLLAPQDGNPG
jgi:Protein O-mannosyl-transferase TMEM260-like